MQPTAASSTATALTLAVLLAGCSAPDSMMSSVALPADDSSEVSAAPGAAASSEGTGSAQPSRLLINGQQRDYLDALESGGVHPSSELLALSIGSYVCQARAAGQNAQAVWEYVHPLVSNDVHNAHMNSMAPTTREVDAATETYIRIATDRLC